MYVSNSGNPEIALRALTATQAPAEEAGLVLSPHAAGQAMARRWYVCLGRYDRVGGVQFFVWILFLLVTFSVLR